ncbi:hypothetical protein PVAG01_07362 [Phlyctema vagabunda]|uniref:Uncharacterized protein n=1 Tax=Phlyctema vagabunda TaxID=108571 RepID=A0ABR4PC79_9HELO
MSRRILRPQSDICHICEFASSAIRPSRSIARAFAPTRSFTTTRKVSAKRQESVTSSKLQGGKPGVGGGSAVIRTPETSSNIPATKKPSILLAKRACEQLLSREIPSEQETLATFQLCEKTARSLVAEPEGENTHLPRNGRAVSAILSLDEMKKAKTSVPQKSMQENDALITELSQLVHGVMRHPPIYISTGILSIYVTIHAILGRAETFPEVLDLYANKPVPEEGSSPIRYAKQNPNKVANAIPLPVSAQALQTAIEARQLGAAIDIVEICYTTKAFIRSKFVRKALLPSTAALVAPLAAYSVASQLALHQATMDSDMATNIAFAGILAYMGFTASIGMVALTTANDQMDRVTWAPGMPLRDRWFREDERAAIDKIAGAWGFRESWRRGEEEGEEWDALREWIGRKGMILDRVELMEGMD